MGNYNTPEDIIQYIKSLESRVEKLEKTNPLNNGTVDTGSLTIKNDAYPTEMKITQSTVFFYQQGSGHATAQPGSIKVDDGETNRVLRMFGPHVGNRRDLNSITVKGSAGTSDRGNIWFYTDGNIQGYADQDISFDADGSAHLLAGVDGTLNAAQDAWLVGGRDVINSAQRNIHILSENDIYINGDGLVYLTAGGGTGQFQINSGILNIFGLPTTTNSGNLFLNTSARVFYGTTSERKFKLDIEPLEMTLEAVLKLADLAVTWTDKGEHEEDPTTPHRLVGWIADDFEEDPWLEQLVEYNEERDIKTITYDRVTAALAVGLKELYLQVQELKGE